MAANGKQAKKKRGSRLGLLDSLRGLTLISMIAYHGAWDLVYIAGVRWPWYGGRGAFVWQQSICWTFILLSGFCVPLSSRPVLRGLQVSLCGALVTLVTWAFLPEDIVICGVLTMIGAAMILTGLLRGLLEKIPSAEMVLACMILFIMTRYVNSGFIGIWKLRLLPLPSSWYANYGTAFLGFPFPGFFSTDYFSLLPWIFLYLAGFFLCRTCQQTGFIRSGFFRVRIPGLEFLGRHSLLIYMLHQPVLYAGIAAFEWFGQIVH